MIDYDLFSVNQEIVQKLIDTALSKGADYADVYFEYATLHEFTMQDKAVNAAGIHTDYGVGIRAIKGDRTGYAYSESTDFTSMENAAKMAASIADGTVCAKRPANISQVKGMSLYPTEDNFASFPTEKAIDYLRYMDNLLFDKDKRVEKVIGRISDSYAKTLFFNSLGQISQDSGPLSSVSVSCILSDGSRTETASTSRSFRMGVEMFSNALAEEIVEDILKKASHQFKAESINGGEMPVVMGAGGSGILLHEAIGHTFEADFNRKGTSIFCDKLGKKICDSAINIVDDGTVPFNRGAISIDDEGVPGQKTYMGKDGVLNSYLHDRISAAHYGVPPTGNGRRESFRFYPLPRMRATYMENGNCTEEDLIRRVKKGVYVDTFSNGQVEIGAGDFTFFVQSGYLIENGKLTKPIKDINVIGNGPAALADIVAVADNFKMDNSTWTCGKEQFCCVSIGMPSVLVIKLVVG